MEEQTIQPAQGPSWQPRLIDGFPEFTPLRLVVQGGDTTLVVDRPEMIAGRHSNADLRLPLPDVSRRHCRFTWVAGRWHVVDLGSLNGLWINDRPVQQAVLEQGDRVRIGGFCFIVQLTGEARNDDQQQSLFTLFAALPQTIEQAPRRLAS